MVGRLAVETFGEAALGEHQGGFKWSGGALGPDGRIYCVPCNTHSALVIDPVSRTVQTFGHYAGVPSYRAMLDREGAQGIEDIAILGDEAEIRAGLGRLEDAGVTDVCLFPYDAEEGSGRRTLELLGSLAG